MVTAAKSELTSLQEIEVLEAAAKLLRFTTAGSVDDGKSTLIGRLLYDSHAVYEDQMASVRGSKINRASGPIDFSLLTDGLRAEREQGITIDVAYRYFSTPKRKFIIADTPGHEQYTRNMATGASTADAAVVLIDATRGVLPQTRRHAYISSLLGIPHLVAAINKMDLVEYSREVFESIVKDFREMAEQLGLQSVYDVPISALKGDNVVRRSSRMAWFEGPALLGYLETIPAGYAENGGPVRFPVQYVSRPNSKFRGFAGELVSGVLERGTSLMVLPSRIRTRVKSIVTYDGELEEAPSGTPITLTLEDEVDISRGDMLTTEAGAPSVSRLFAATLVWMHSDRLDPEKLYVLKHTTRTVRARVTVRDRIDVNTFAHAPATTLEINDIGAADLETTLPLFFDPYRRNRITGSFILIDPITNATVAAGMIEESSEPTSSSKHAGSTVKEHVTTQERSYRMGHRPAAVWVNSHADAIEIERRLFDEGWFVQVVGGDFHADEVPAVARVLRSAGLIGIFWAPESEADHKRAVRVIFGSGAFFDLDDEEGADLPVTDRIVNALREWREPRWSKGEKR